MDELGYRQLASVGITCSLTFEIIAIYNGLLSIIGVFDGLQANAARARRGVKDSIVALWIAGFGYWFLGIGGGTLLVFTIGLGGAGLLWGFALGIALGIALRLMATSPLLTLCFHTLTTP